MVDRKDLLGLVRMLLELWELWSLFLDYWLRRLVKYLKGRHDDDARGDCPLASFF